MKLLFYIFLVTVHLVLTAKLSLWLAVVGVVLRRILLQHMKGVCVTREKNI